MNAVVLWALWGLFLVGCVSGVAFWVAASRNVRPFLSRFFGVVIVACAPFVFAAWTVMLTLRLRSAGVAPSWLGYTLGWGAVYVTAAALVVLYGLRRAPSGPGLRADSWRSRRLALLAGGSILAAVVLFIVIDDRRKSELRGLKQIAQDLVVEESPSGANAFDLYRVLRAELGTRLERPKWFGLLHSDSSVVEGKLDPSAMANYLERMKSATRLVHRATDLEHCQRPKPTGVQVNMFSDELIAALRDASAMLALEARVLAERGDIVGALSVQQRMWTVVRHLVANATAFELAAAARRAAEASETLTAVLAHASAETKIPPPSPNAGSIEILSEADVDRAIDRMGAALLWMLADHALGEVPEGESGDALFVKRSGGRSLAPRQSAALALWRVYVVRADVQSLREILRAQKTRARLPYPEVRTQAADRGWLRSVTSQRGLVTQRLSPTLAEFYPRAAASVRTHYRLAAVALAAAAYRSAKGSLPEKAEDLVPEWIDDLPEDPYDGRQIKLALFDGRLLIYSSGPDGVDHEGIQNVAGSDVVLALEP